MGMLPVILFHYGLFQPLWRQPGLLQCGPQMTDGPESIHVASTNVIQLQEALILRGLPLQSALIHYTDPFLIRAAELRGLIHWRGPKLLACGDLHHGETPIEILVDYQSREFHDALLLTFNPSLLNLVRSRITVPVNSMPPGFFRYPTRKFNPFPQKRLLHVGSLGNFHRKRRQLIEELLSRAKIPFSQLTTNTSEEAADLYNGSALVLNVPLNNDLNHRFFEIMAAGSSQVIFGNKELLGPHKEFEKRADIFWVNSIVELERLVIKLFDDTSDFIKPVDSPPKYTINELLRCCFSF